MLKQPGKSSFQSIAFNLIHLIKLHYWRMLMASAFGVLFCLLLRNVLFMLQTPSAYRWLMGDWLINYQGGFVRRGLLGEIAFQISHLLEINPVAVIVVIQVLCYFLFLLNTFRLSIHNPFSPLLVALIFSPAFMLFPVIDIQGSFRKEILFFALLSTLCVYLLTSKRKTHGGLILCVALASVVIVLSHEMFISFFPYLICAFIIYEKGLGAASRKIIPALLPAAAVTIFILFFGRGNTQIVADICKSLQTYAPGDCTTEGAIYSLGMTINDSHALVLKNSEFETLAVYLLTALLGLLPLGLMLLKGKFAKTINDRRMVIWLIVLITLAIICSLPLFWVAADYGRLIYIHLTCLSLLALMANYKSEEVSQPFTLRQVVPWVLCILYLSSWRLIHIHTYTYRAFPVFQVIEKVVSNRAGWRAWVVTAIKSLFGGWIFN